MKWITAIWNGLVGYHTPVGTTSPDSNMPPVYAPSLGSGIYNNGGHEPGGTYEAEYVTEFGNPYFGQRARHDDIDPGTDFRNMPSENEQ